METTRGLLFGSVAERYEQYRSGYPDALVDVVTEYAGRPLNTALEVGAGTGKATRVFASRGIEVTALEPDEGMAAVLTRTTASLPVRLVASPLEEFASSDRFDLVFAVASWHWTRPETRWSQAVRLLEDGGVLALVRGGLEPADPEVLAAVEDLEKRLFGEGNQAGHGWTPEEMDAVDGLTDVVERELPLRATGTAEELVGRLGTVSAYLQLPPVEQAAALRQVRDLLPDRLELRGTLTVSLARRVSP